MEKLIDFLNSIVEKYGMDEADVKKLQELVFSIETAEDALDGDANAQDFVVPEGDNEDEYDEYED